MLLMPDLKMPLAKISDYIDIQDDKEYKILMKNQKNDNNISFEGMTFYQTLFPFGNDEQMFSGLLEWNSQCSNLNKCEIRYFFKKFKSDSVYKYATAKNMYLTREGQKFQLHWDIFSSYTGNEDKFDSQLTYDYTKEIVAYHNNNFWSTENLDLDQSSQSCSVQVGSPGFYDICFKSNPFGNINKSYGITFFLDNDQGYQGLEEMIIVLRNYD